MLWFWCVKNPADECQRTLGRRPARSGIAPGRPLAVTVRGYDEAGRGVRVAGATVRLGGASAVTGADGVATVAAPAAGRSGCRRRRPAWSCRSASGSRSDDPPRRPPPAPPRLRHRGCGLGAGESEGGGATLTVTRDFGTREVGTGSADPLPGGETVMRMLQRDFDVDTRYGGGFVQSINGIAGGQEDGRPVDWFFYVNGILADQGATAHKLTDGDDIWWDHHDWGTTADVRAVVGAFPEPFVTGVDGKRLPVRLDCAGSAEAPATRSPSGSPTPASRPDGRPRPASAGRACCGSRSARWSDLRRDPAVRRLEEGPRASGVYARLNAAGDELALLDPEGETVRTLGAGSGLVAATQLGGEAPTWVVTGTDAVGLAAAAAQLERAALADRFAVAVEDGRPLPLPVQPPPEAP